MIGDTNAQSIQQDHSTLTLPTEFTTGWIMKFKISPNTYLYQIADLKASATGDYVIDSSNPPYQSVRAILTDPDTRAITGLAFSIGNGLTIRVLQANAYMVGQAIVTMV